MTELAGDDLDTHESSRFGFHNNFINLLLYAFYFNYQYRELRVPVPVPIHVHVFIFPKL